MRFRLLATSQALSVSFALATVAYGQTVAVRPQEPLSHLPVEVPAATRMAASSVHADSAKLLHVAISLPFANQAAIEAFVDSVSDPNSPNYRHFLTPQEVGERFGLPAIQVARVRSYLEANGFKIRLVAGNRLAILADATVAQAEAAFKTTIDEYRRTAIAAPGKSDFFAFSKPLQVPTSIAGAVLDVSGLENLTRPQPRALNPTQTRTLYNLAPAYNGGLRGQGRNVGISNWDGYRLSNVPLYYSQYGLPAPSGGVGSNIRVVTISGGAGSGSPSGEGDLDIQMVLGMAPLSNFTIYDGGSSDLIGVLTSEVNENVCDVISESYGWNLPASTAA